MAKTKQDKINAARVNGGQGGGGAGGGGKIRPGGGGGGTNNQGKPVKPTASKGPTVNVNATGSSSNAAPTTPATTTITKEVNGWTVTYSVDANGKETEVSRVYNPNSNFNKNAAAVARAELERYGLGSFASLVDGMVQQYGDNYGLYAQDIRQSQEYKTRFDGYIKLQQSGNVHGMTMESDYLKLEDQYRTLFKQNGLTNMIADASGNDWAGISKLISNFNLSVDEVGSRIADAKRVISQDTPNEVKQALKDFYGIGENDLLSYALNPDNAAEDLNRKANAATFAGLAKKTGLNVGEQFARETVQGIYSNDDINSAKMSQELNQAAVTQKETERLAQLEGGTLSAEESISSQLGLDAKASEKVKGLQSRERARFGGSSAVRGGTLKRSGI